eukprot:UN01916
MITENKMIYLYTSKYYNSNNNINVFCKQLFFYRLYLFLILLYKFNYVIVSLKSIDVIHVSTPPICLLLTPTFVLFSFDAVIKIPLTHFIF